MLETIKTTLEVLGATAALLAVIWTGLRLFHRYYERFLFFSGCHLLSLTLRDDIQAQIQNQNARLKEQLADHAFRPLIILPRKVKKYFNVKDGSRVILKFRPPNGDELMITAQAFWYPEDSKLWDLFDQPAVSLIVRRYFGIERPLLGHEDTAHEDTAHGEWHLVAHGTARNGKEELAILHRTSEKNGNLIWLASKKYSVRFWLPERDAKGARYRSEWEDGWFLEYGGISLQVAKPSILSLKA